MKKLKVGIIGVGRRGRMPINHLPNDLVELVMIAESDPATKADFEAEFPHVRTTTDWKEVVRDSEVEAIFVMVRDYLHEEFALAALEAGKDVYLEKPMAITIEGCDRLLETAWRTGHKLYVGHNMRFMTFVNKMRELVLSGIIGNIQTVWVRHFVNYGSCYFRHWCAEQQNCTGLLLQKGAHDIDIIHYITGSYTKRVSAMGRLSVYNRTADRLAEDELPDRNISFTPECWPPLEVTKLSSKLDIEDHNMVMMQLENGIQAVYMHCMYTPDSERNYTFIGDRGRIENVGDYREDAQIHVWTQRGSRQKPDIVYNLQGAGGGHGGSDPKIVRNFVKYCLGLEKPLTDPVAARNAVAVGVLGHKSARNGSIPFDIPPPPECKGIF